MSLKEAEKVRKIAQTNGFLVSYIITGNDNKIRVEVTKK